MQSKSLGDWSKVYLWKEAVDQETVCCGVGSVPWCFLDSAQPLLIRFLRFLPVTPPVKRGVVRQPLGLFIMPLILPRFSPVVTHLEMVASKTLRNNWSCIYLLKRLCIILGMVWGGACVACHRVAMCVCVYVFSSCYRLPTVFALPPRKCGVRTKLKRFRVLPGKNSEHLHFGTITRRWVGDVLCTIRGSTTDRHANTHFPPDFLYWEY